MRIERVFHPYTAWEGWQAGLYAPPPVSDPEWPALAAQVLAVPSVCENAMRLALVQWPREAEHHLSDTSCNRRAWLGRAAMYLGSGAPDSVGRTAWSLLTREEQARADAIANRLIHQWEEARTGSCLSDLLG